MECRKANVQEKDSTSSLSLSQYFLPNDKRSDRSLSLSLNTFYRMIRDPTECHMAKVREEKDSTRFCSSHRDALSLSLCLSQALL